MAEDLPMIGIPLRPWSRAGKPRRLMQDRSYFDVVAAGGGVPLPLPITSRRQLRQLYALCDGILLPGGRDVEPGAYGATAPPDLHLQTHPELDQVEIELVEWARADRLPLFGICRGAQLLNVALGGSLWVDLEQAGQSRPGVHTAANGAPPGSQVSHETTIVAPSWLHRVIGAGAAVVNSRHHQAPRLLGRGVLAVAHAPDGVVEAIEVDDDGWFAVGVQWHPEELPADDPAGPGLVRAFVALTAHHRPSRQIMDSRRAYHPVRNP
jgi:putative glutamine amidotransferase